MLTEFLIKYLFRIDREIIIPLGNKVQKGCIITNIQSKAIWKQESAFKKICSIIRLQWEPTDSVVKSIAKEILIREVFGTDLDYSNKLYELMIWHNSRNWSFDNLSESDKIRAEGLESLSILTRMRYYNESSDFLHLNLFSHAPQICILVHPMIVKIPIISFQYFLDIHPSFAFNSIRKSNHTYANDIILFLYEILFLQQKIAISLHEFLRLIAYTEEKKKEALFIQSEINAIINVDNIITYLKASIEKTIVLIGLIYGITNLDSKKTHKAKLDALTRELPKLTTDQFYYQFVLEFIQTENIDELNNYRSGLLHKKGISDLQPHNYFGKKDATVPLRKIFQILHEQHSKNTAVLIGTLALLTDELVRLDPPDIKISEIPM